MADADLVITGTVLTVDDARPTAEALAVADGRIIAVGNRSDVAGLIGPDTRTIDVGSGCVMPGFIEAHGHPLMEAIALSDRIVDIRPVTIAQRGRRRRKRSAARPPHGVRPAHISMAGTRCCSRGFRSRRWPGSTTSRRTGRW